MSDFLGFTDKTFLVTGFANRKSVAWHVSKILEKEGARVIFTVRSENRKNELLALKPDAEIIICDFENSKEIETIEKIKKPTWLPPQPFLNLGVRSKLLYERFKAISDI